MAALSSWFWICRKNRMQELQSHGGLHYVFEKLICDMMGFLARRAVEAFSLILT